jgi:hypothetical protein
MMTLVDDDSELNSKKAFIGYVILCHGISVIFTTLVAIIMRTFVANQQLEATLESLIKRGVAFSVGLLLGQV